ncbi:hypothetical protein ACHAWF_007039 [Thalassiosira exigua]
MGIGQKGVRRTHPPRGSIAPSSESFVLRPCLLQYTHHPPSRLGERESGGLGTPWGHRQLDTDLPSPGEEYDDEAAGVMQRTRSRARGGWRRGGSRSARGSPFAARFAVLNESGASARRGHSFAGSRAGGFRYI